MKMILKNQQTTFKTAYPFTSNTIQNGANNKMVIILKNDNVVLPNK